MRRKLLFCLEHIHLEDPGLKGVAGGNQKQNILYVLTLFVLGVCVEHDFCHPLYSSVMLAITLHIIILQRELYDPFLMLLYFVSRSKL
jgi:hypothetical protein